MASRLPTLSKRWLHVAMKRLDEIDVFGPRKLGRSAIISDRPKPQRIQSKIFSS